MADIESDEKFLFLRVFLNYSRKKFKKKQKKIDNCKK